MADMSDSTIEDTGNSSESTQPNSRPRRNTPPIHPLLFAIYPVLALLAHNIAQTPLNQTLRAFGVALLVTVCVWAVLLLITRKLRKSAAAASAIVLVALSYGHLVDLAPASMESLIGPLCLLALVISLAALFRTQQPLFDTTAVLNLAAVALVAPSVWSVAVETYRNGHNSVQMASSSANSAPVHRRVLGPAAPDSPDIYYIILDAYGRADRLMQFYHYDNSQFISELEKRGFYVAEQSGANYDQTHLCLASSLNMNYLDAAKQDLSMEHLRQMVDDSAVADFLQDHGYHYVSIWSGQEVSRVTTAETLLNTEGEMNGFETQAFNLTAAVANGKFRMQRYDQHRKCVQGVFNNLDTVAKLPSPKFVFAHALSPHPPFVIGPHGESLYPPGAIIYSDGSWLLDRITRDDYIKGYTGQLQYINARVLEAIDSILANSRRKPIIIIQGDHGSRMNVDWDSEKRTDLREPFSILNAYLVPDKVKSRLYPTITPVNSFRTVFYGLFKANYGKLPDRSFYSTASESTKFLEVTNLIPNATGPEEPPLIHHIRHRTGENGAR